MLTKDKAGLRINFFVRYQVVDILKALVENKDFEILTILSKAVKKMSEGELLQMEKTRNLNFDESVYYEIINGKTASLLSSSCAAGAASGHH